MWLWNGANWIQVTPSGPNPGARDLLAMAGDAASGQVVLYGGIGEDCQCDLNDTWVWNGTNWTQESPATSPPARDEHAMAYDAAQGVVVLFGGDQNGGCCYNDTWVWNGTNSSGQPPGA
jgi:hypothetical protein